MWKEFNPNPNNARVGDCVIRAISKALNKSWKEIYLDLCIYGLILSDMPSANHVWGSYLKDKGFKRYILPDSCPNCYTVKDFCNDHKQGTYILALNGHVICSNDGNYYDTWDSGDEVPIYYWKEEPC